MSAAGTYLAVPVQPAAVLWAAVPAVTADRARAPAASADHRVCDPAVVEDELEAEAEAGGGGKGETKMKNTRSSLIEVFCSVGLVLALAAGILTAQAPTAGGNPDVQAPEEAAEALILAAEKFDAAAFQRIFGTDAQDIILTGEPANDKEVANAFAAQARTKNSLTIDPTNKSRAYLLVGSEEWPFPVPVVKRSGLWVFDTAAGRQELLYRRIGGNELDAIEVCCGYVEAQHEYALEPHDGVNQYAQRVISTPGKQDGLAWQNAGGTWEGPIGENVARAIERGYGPGDPYHGYYFKVLTGQGPAAPLGEMDFVVKGIMIGGFALIATPSQYGVTGVKTFMVSQTESSTRRTLAPIPSIKRRRLSGSTPTKHGTS